MKIRAQIGMVLNLDKCIGCHTCSVTCKMCGHHAKAWNTHGLTTSKLNRIGYPDDWENQERWNGGWERLSNGKIRPKLGAKWRVLANIFANPDLPQIDDYYEPFTFDYSHLQQAPESKVTPTARPVSTITGKVMDKIEKGQIGKKF